jgi:hypothetical protein
MAKRIVRSAFVALGAALALSATFGAAASLDVTSPTLGAGKATVARCDTDGIVASPTWSGSNVSGVTLSGIAAACAAKTASVTVANGVTIGTGSAPVPSGGGSLSLTIAPAVLATTSLSLNVVI